MCLRTRAVIICGDWTGGSSVVFVPVTSQDQKSVKGLEIHVIEGEIKCAGRGWLNRIIIIIMLDLYCFPKRCERLIY